MKPALLCALAALGSTALGCRGSTRSPVRTVQELSEAAREGDLGRVMRLIGPRTRARLEADARRAGEQAGRRKIQPSELLAAGWTPPRYEFTEVYEVSRSGEVAEVEIAGRHGERERVEVVREGKEWKVELP
ncbi:MAG: hypothetical protein EXR72_01050 [Myxococcales bacterium]|nr:hypothetical protein [Myxococcales bacterium]